MDDARFLTGSGRRLRSHSLTFSLLDYFPGQASHQLTEFLYYRLGVPDPRPRTAGLQILLLGYRPAVPATQWCNLPGEPYDALKAL